MITETLPKLTSPLWEPLSLRIRDEIILRIKHDAMLKARMCLLLKIANRTLDTKLSSNHRDLITLDTVQLICDSYNLIMTQVVMQEL